MADSRFITLSFYVEDGDVYLQRLHSGPGGDLGKAEVENKYLFSVVGKGIDAQTANARETLEELVSLNDVEEPESESTPK